MKQMKEELDRLVASVGAPDASAVLAAKAYQARLAKPPGSLGRLESLAVQLAGITGRVQNTLAEKRILVFAADNGVTEEGVASAPQAVTRLQTLNMAHGKSGAAVLAKQFGCEMCVCDVGINAEIDDAAVLNQKIAYGTKNIAKEPAMTRAQALRALLCGAELAAAAADEGVCVLGVGEMGIGNTTTAAAVLAALTGKSAAEVTGRGAGVTDKGYARKLAVIDRALARRKPVRGDVVDVLSKVGGLDIAAMTGAFLGAAAKRLPVVIDGLISVVAALCAYRLCPASRAYMIPSHKSFEIGYRTAAAELAIEPLFDLSMRLGEGSGCPLAMMLLDAACAVTNGMATFEDAGIDDGYLEMIRKTDAFSVKGN